MPASYVSLNTIQTTIRSLVLIALVSVPQFAFALSNSGITYQGRIMKPDDTPVSGAQTKFRMKILTTGTDNCVMYQEEQEQDLSDSDGNFSLTLNDGSGSRQDTPTYDIEQIFANKGTFTFHSTSCPTTDVTYAPGPDDHRILVVEFKDETMLAWEPMPAQTINYVPMALQAKNIAGFGIGNLVRVQEADGSFISNVTPLSNANYDALKLLVAGTSALYEKPGKLGGITVPSMGATPGKVLGWDGSAWTVADPTAGVQAFAKTALPACATGAYLRNNSGALECTTPAAGTTGTVTEIRTGVGLTGGPINDDGEIALAVIGTVGTGYKVSYDIYGRVTGAAAIAQADIPKLTTAGKVSGDAITDGKIAGTTEIDTTGLIKSTSGSFTALGTQGIQVFKTDNSYSVSIIANLALGSNYTLTLPVDGGTSGQVLMTNGSGGLSWTNAASGSVTSLTGDVTSTGTGAVATTIAANAVTTGKISDGNVTFAKIQNVPTASIVGRYSSGSGAPESLTLGTGLTLSAGGVLSSNITDTDTFAAVTTACGNGTVPLKAAGVWTCSTPTPLATSSAIVQRDGSGNFAANVVTINGLALDNAGSIVNLVNLAGSAYTLTMPVGLGTSGQVLGTSGSGQLTWTTPAAPGTGDFKADGSVPMTGNLQLNGHYLSGDGGAEGVFVSSDGKVGIGTTSPLAKLDVAGAVKVADTLDACISGLNGSIRFNGGNLQYCVGTAWTTLGAAGAGLTALTGDVTASGSGSQAATIATGAVTSGKILDGTIATADIADDNVTFAKIQNVPTATIAGRYTSGSGDLESLTLGTGLALSAGGVLSSNIVDTDTFASTLGACANGTVPLRAGGVWTCGVPTPLATNSAIVQRDGSGGFAAGAITATSSVLKDSGSNTVTIQAPTTVSASYVLRLPAAVGGAGQMLQTDASGNLSWATPSSAGITALTGDVTGTGPGSTATTIAANAITSGKIVDGTIVTADLADASVTFAKIQNVPTTSIMGRFTSGSGAPESLTLGTGLTLSGAGVLSSNIVDTDTFASTLGACANGTVPLRAGGVWTCGVPTPLSTSSALVQRDGTGNFAANIITMNGAALNNAGSVVNLVNLAGSAYTLTMPVGLGTSGQVLGTSGSGQLTWTTPAAPGTGDFKADGTVPMTGNLQLNGKWLSGDGGNEGIQVAADGKVGIAGAPSAFDLRVNGTTGFLGAVYVQNGGRVDVTQNNSTVYAASGSTASPNAATAGYTAYNNFGADGTTSLIELATRNTATRIQSGYMGVVAANGASNYSPALVFGQQTASAAYAERMRIDTNGYVGIGTSAPDAKLDVKGIVKISGSTSGAVGLQVPAIAGSTIYTLPTTPTNGYVLSTDAAGVMSWIAQSAATGDFKADGSVTMTGSLKTNGTVTAAGTSIVLQQTGDTYGATRLTLQNRDGLNGALFENTGLELVDFGFKTAGGTQRNLRFENRSGNIVSSSNSAVGEFQFTQPPGEVGNAWFVTGPNATVVQSGNVGIGALVPAAKLHLSQASGTRILVEATGTTAGPSIGLKSSGAGGHEYSLVSSQTSNGVTGSFQIFDQTASATRLLIDGTTGNVGIGLGVAAGEKLEVNGNVKATSFIATSDGRLKKNVTKTPGLDFIKQLTGVTWQWKSNNLTDAGVIAQDVEKVMPYAVATDAKTGMKGVKYNALIAPLIESTKELYGMCEAHDRRIASLEERAVKAETRVQELERTNAAFEARLRKLEESLRHSK